MTEQKAIEILSLSEDMKKQLPNLKEVYEVAVKALKEVRRYRALEQRVKNLFGENMDLFGLVEELRTVKKQIPKRVQDAEVSENPEDMQYMGEDALYGHCPTCGNIVCSVWNTYYCDNCGQAIDWRNK